MARPRTLLLGVLAAALLAAGAAWLVPRARVRALLASVPTLDATLARHLIGDPPARFRAYARAAGPRPLMDGWSALYRRLQAETYARFARDRVALERLMLRLADALAGEYDYHAPARYVRARAALPARLDYARYQLVHAYVEASESPTLAPAARLAQLDRARDALAAAGDADMTAAAQFAAAEAEVQLDRLGPARARFEDALARERVLGDDYLACQILGELAFLHDRLGERDSFRTRLDEGIAIAVRHRFPDQTARLLLFAARRDVDDGRLAHAADRLLEASELCEAFGGGSTRVRLALEYARFLADLDCWEAVERTLRRLPPLLREFPARVEPAGAARYAFDADCLRAQVAFAAGDPADGARQCARLVATVPAEYRRVGLPIVYDQWARGLQRAGEPAPALVACEHGLSLADSTHATEIAIPLALRRARLLESLGRLAGAEAAANDAARWIASDPNQGGADRIALEVLRGRLLLERGRIAAGRARLAAAFRLLRARAPRFDPDDPPGPGERVGLSLRDAVHELARLSPAASYGFELEWRSLARRPGPDAGARGPAAVPRDPFAPAEPTGSGLHLLYRFEDGRLLRWTAGARVERDTVRMSAESCLAQVRAAVALLQAEPAAPGGGLGACARDALRRLAAELLPAPLAAGIRPPARLEIAPDGPLVSLPFEALPVGPDGAPLAARTDVVYGEGWSAAADPPGAAGDPGRTLILSNPALAPGLRRRYAWAGTLAGSEQESRAARRRWPAATVLDGDGATRRAFERLAPGAANVYIAAHHVKDPGAPFLGFIPLAAPAGADRGAGLLEATDVRALDLTACRLAVLASCASGAPYRGTAEPGPSLGDAFLDAGARAVVASFWDVGDEEARSFMQRFLARERPGGDPAAALAAARREAIAAGAPPRVWAAWSVAVVHARPQRGAEPGR